MRVVALVSLIVLLVPLSADAYTIVLRDGRRLEIPNQFKLLSQRAALQSRWRSLEDEARPERRISWVAEISR